MSTIEIMICIFCNTALLILFFCISMSRIDKLEAQQQKDRSDIADYLNEQLKNK